MQGTEEALPLEVRQAVADLYANGHRIEHLVMMTGFPKATIEEIIANVKPAPVQGLAFVKVTKSTR